MRRGHSEEIEVEVEVEVEEVDAEGRGKVGGRLGRFDEVDGTTTFLTLTSLARAAVTPELAAGAGRFPRIEEEERLVELAVVIVVGVELCNPSDLARSTDELNELVVECERGQGDRVQVWSGQRTEEKRERVVNISSIRKRKKVGWVGGRWWRKEASSRRAWVFDVFKLFL